jgi:hypothetical protein
VEFSAKTKSPLGNNPAIPMEQRRGHAPAFEKTKVT